MDDHIRKKLGEGLLFIRALAQQDESVGKWCDEVEKLLKPEPPPLAPEMQRFRVVRRFDAWKNYEAIIYAPSPKRALALAKDDRCDWKEGDVDEFDAHYHEVYDANDNLLIEESQP